MKRDWNYTTILWHICIDLCMTTSHVWWKCNGESPRNMIIAIKSSIPNLIMQMVVMTGTLILGKDCISFSFRVQNCKAWTQSHATSSPKTSKLDIRISFHTYGKSDSIQCKSNHMLQNTTITTIKNQLKNWKWEYWNYVENPFLQKWTFNFAFFCPRTFQDQTLQYINS